MADAQRPAARVEVAFGERERLLDTQPKDWGGKIVTWGSLLVAIIVAIASTSR